MSVIFCTFCSDMHDAFPLRARDRRRSTLVFTKK